MRSLPYTIDQFNELADALETQQNQVYKDRTERIGFTVLASGGFILSGIIFILIIITITTSIK